MKLGEGFVEKEASHDAAALLLKEPFSISLCLAKLTRWCSKEDPSRYSTELNPRSKPCTGCFVPDNSQHNPFDQNRIIYLELVKERIRRFGSNSENVLCFEFTSPSSSFDTPTEGHVLARNMKETE